MLESRLLPYEWCFDLDDVPWSTWFRLKSHRDCIIVGFSNSTFGSWILHASHGFSNFVPDDKGHASMKGHVHLQRDHHAWMQPFENA